MESIRNGRPVRRSVSICRASLLIHSAFAVLGRSVALLSASLLLVTVLVRPVHAQATLSMEEVNQYVDGLDADFWEQAWARHLRDDASSDGTIDWNYEERQSLNAFTDRYQRLVAEADGFWSNLQVQDYLQRRLLAVQPNAMMPGRPGAFTIRVLRTSTPSSLAFSDGTILLTTGLLTTLRTEAELEAVLAHEVAHVVLDHAREQYQSGQKRNRARNILGTLGRVASGVASTVTPLNFGGAASLPETQAYGLEDGLSTRYLMPDVLEAAGLEYNNSQEAAANRLAQQWLLSTDRPPAALHTALRALRRAGTYGSDTRRASFLDSHPVPDDLRAALEPVFEEAGRDPSVLDAEAPQPGLTYDTRIAAVLEHEAEMDLAARRYRSALTVLDRAIRAQWTAPKAYLLKAIAVRNTATGSADHTRALALLDTAEARTDAPEPRIDAERALVRLRQGETAAAWELLARCVETIDGMQPTADKEPYTLLRAWAADMVTRLRDPSSDQPASRNGSSTENSASGASQ